MVAMGADPELDVTVVVPCYSGEGTIEELFAALQEVLGGGGTSFEVLFVCDDPVDGSWAVVRRARARHESCATRWETCGSGTA